MVFIEPARKFVHGGMRGKPRTPYRYRRLETTGAVSVSCIRVHISEIGEIDVPGTWGQCKYYAYRGMCDGVGGKRRGGAGRGKDYRCVSKGNAHPGWISTALPRFDDTRDPKFSVGT